MSTPPNPNGLPPIPMRPVARPPAPVAPVAQRTAAAFAEIRALEEQHAALEAENASLKRAVDQQDNKIDLLQAALDDERQNSRIYQRKLIRLATSMAGIGALTAEAEKIMRDTKEVEEAQAETEREREQRSKEPPSA